MPEITGRVGKLPDEEQTSDAKSASRFVVDPRAPETFPIKHQVGPKSARAGRAAAQLLVVIISAAAVTNIKPAERTQIERLMMKDDRFRRVV